MATDSRARTYGPDGALTGDQGDNTMMTDPEPKDDDAQDENALVEAQDEAAKEREEEGGYQ